MLTPARAQVIKVAVGPVVKLAVGPVVKVAVGPVAKLVEPRSAALNIHRSSQSTRYVLCATFSKIKIPRQFLLECNKKAVYKSTR
jgi:hypothetical protein